MRAEEPRTGPRRFLLRKRQRAHLPLLAGRGGQDLLLAHAGGRLLRQAAPPVISVEFVQERLQKLKETLKDTKRLVVLTHDNPDPDSISCAVALSAIVTQVFGVPSIVRYSGIVGRAE